MKINEYKEKFILTGQSIDGFSEKLEEYLNLIGMERQNRLRIRLSLEEALLRMRDRFGEETEVAVLIHKHLGRLIIQVEEMGDAYNPLSSEENELEDLCSSLLTAIGLSPQYSYSGGKNSLRISLPLPGLNPVLKIVISILGGILIGLIGTALLSASMRNSAINIFMTPVYDLWIRILNVMSGPVIFFMVITTMLDAGKISSRGGDSWHIVGRYFILSFIMVLAALLVAEAFFPLVREADDIIIADTIRGFEKLLEFVPGDFFTPFVNSNTPQLLLMAFVLGSALNTLGSQAGSLVRVIRQINMVGLQLAEWVSDLVPFFAAVLVGLEIWQKRTAILSGLWMCYLIALAVSALCIFVVMLVVSNREKASLRDLALKLWGPFALTVRSGSLDAAYGQTEKCCNHQLGISHEFTTLSLPNGLVLYMPISAVGTIVFMVYASKIYGVEVSALWFVSAVILAVVLFVATPPVPGANLLAYTAIFVQLGLPREALIDAMIFDIVFGIFASAGNQALLQLELILQSDRIGLLKKDLLRRKATGTRT